MSKPIILELDESIVFVALKYDLSFNEYKLLADWLECYNYVLPAERGLINSFVMSWQSEVFETPTQIYKLWMKSNLIYTTLTPAKQRRIMSWLITS